MLYSFTLLDDLVHLGAAGFGKPRAHLPADRQGKDMRIVQYSMGGSDQQQLCLRPFFMGISVCRTAPFKIHSTKTHSRSHNLWTEWLQKHYRSPVLSPPCTAFNLFSTQLQRDLDQKKWPPSPNLPVSLNKYKLFLPFLVRPYMTWFLLFLLTSFSQFPIKPCVGTTCLLVFQPVQLHNLCTCCSLCLGNSFPQPLAWHVSILHSSLRSSLQRPLL